MVGAVFLKEVVGDQDVEHGDAGPGHGDKDKASHVCGAVAVSVNIDCA